MRRATVHLLTLIVALAAGRAAADGLSIDGPEAVAPYRIVRLKASGVPDKAGVIWRVRPVAGTPTVDWASRQNTKNVEWVAPPGQYRVELTAATVAADGTVSLDYAERVVTIGDAPSPPPGPGPGPGPTPGPAPIPLPGFRVLMVVESADLSKLPAAQVAVLTAADVRAYLNAKCAVGPNGVNREWRQWDKDVVTANEAPHWQAAMARPRQSLPWIVISTGTAGYEGPLPATVAETLTLLKRFGG